MATIKQLLIRFGIIKPPEPYGIEFQRRADNSINRIALRDCIGIGQ